MDTSIPKLQLFEEVFKYQ